MKILKILILLISLIFANNSSVMAQDCSKLDILSKEYAKCNAEFLKNKTSGKIEEGKKKFYKLKIKEKLLKFKKSKSLKDFVEN